MLKMVLTVPRGFDVEQFCHVVSAVSDSWKEHYDWHDYDLSECVFSMDSLTEGKEKYHIAAGYIDLEIIDTITEMQKICPQVEMHFEGDGEVAKFEDDEFYYSELYFEVFKSAGMKKQA